MGFASCFHGYVDTVESPEHPRVNVVGAGKDTADIELLASRFPLLLKTGEPVSQGFVGEQCFSIWEA